MVEGPTMDDRSTSVDHHQFDDRRDLTASVVGSNPISTHYSCSLCEARIRIEVTCFFLVLKRRKHHALRMIHLTLLPHHQNFSY